MLAELSDANECRDVWEFCDNRFRDKRWKIAESRFDLEPVDSAPLMEEEREEERTRGWRVSCDAIEARVDIRLPRYCLELTTREDDQTGGGKDGRRLGDVQQCRYAGSILTVSSVTIVVMAAATRE